MVKGRRKAKRETARVREAEAREAEEHDRRQADERAAADHRLAQKWGREAAALDRLSAISRELEKLHREEARLLHDRDELVHWLRQGGQSWTMLSARTRLSRQALMKRIVGH